MAAIRSLINIFSHIMDVPRISELWIKSKDPVNLVNGIGKRFVKALGLDKEGGRPAEEGSFSLEFQVSLSSPSFPALFVGLAAF